MSWTSNSKSLSHEPTPPTKKRKRTLPESIPESPPQSPPSPSQSSPKPKEPVLCNPSHIPVGLVIKLSGDLCGTMFFPLSIFNTAYLPQRLKTWALQQKKLTKLKGTSPELVTEYIEENYETIYFQLVIIGLSPVFIPIKVLHLVVRELCTKWRESGFLIPKIHNIRDKEKKNVILFRIAEDFPENIGFALRHSKEVKDITEVDLFMSFGTFSFP